VTRPGPGLAAEDGKPGQKDSAKRTLVTRRNCLIFTILVAVAFVVSILLIYFDLIPRYIEALLNRDEEDGREGREPASFAGFHIDSFTRDGVAISIANLTMPVMAGISLKTFVEASRFDISACPETASVPTIPPRLPAFECGTQNRTFLYSVNLPRLNFVPGEVHSSPLSFSATIDNIAGTMSGRFNKILAEKENALPSYGKVSGRPTVGAELFGIPFRWTLSLDRTIAFDTADIFRNTSKYALKAQPLGHNGTAGSFPFPSEEPLEFLAGISFYNPYSLSLRVQPFAISAQIYSNESYPGQRLGEFSLPRPRMFAGSNEGNRRETNVTFVTNPDNHERLLGIAAKIILHVPVSVAIRNVVLIPHVESNFSVPVWLQGICDSIDMSIDLRDISRK
jgi:hypothetical protein